MASQHKKKLIAALSANKLADILISAKTTLPALLISMGAPVWMIGWLVPIRESGALLPQAVIGILLRKMRARHTVWRVGIIIQVLAVLAIFLAGLLLAQTRAGWVVLAALVILSVGRSICSLTIKDIEADVAQKGERGDLIGKASTLSGILTLLVAVPMVFFQDRLGIAAILGLVLTAAAAFFCTFLLMLPVKTYVDTDQSDNQTSEKTAFWQFDAVVYRFVLVRGLFVHSALVAPYFMLESGAGAEALLPLYLAAQAAAAMLSSLIWGRVSDYSARTTLQLAGVIAVLACIGLLLIDAASVWISGLLFFVLSVAHTGVRTGRKTYSLDVREGQGRTELVAFSNTAIGLILLAFGALYAVLESVLNISVVYIMTAMLVIAIALTVILPEEKDR
ncbi:MFS transporter [Salinimonas sp. HHU 13199]|uniref:MFS transporter n=1 Tax=Salinimonas profundi TaxID=2729140 RepID=A0ABR8LHQ7_9ALTE|nr:MFS transporter [Salinimonas profundi]MBD3584835.1 MFS transporter [Salinimonas profundi]